ncbi:MAG: glycosyltransferase family 9 protein [Ignavibacteria bacterium]|nr:glycosyltransferase family 9 protein [Ignavibacteria bacterium]
MQLEKLHKILIVRLSSLGDVLLTTPIFRSLKKAYPDLIIHSVVLDSYYDVLKNNPYINSVWKYQKNRDDEKNLNKTLINEEFDAVIDLQNNFRSRRLLNNVCQRTFRLDKLSIKKFLLVNFKINLLKDSQSIPERYAFTIPGLRLDNEGLEIFIPSSKTSRIKEGEKIIGFCPGSRHYTKMWAEEYYVELGKKLKSIGYRIALFGGSSDIFVCQNLENKIDGSINLSTEDDILQLAADMRNCKAIVCNDSGLMHAACAVNVPVLSIFGSTVKEFGFFPYKCDNLVLENNSLSCRPCSHIGKDNCPKRHFRCMKDLTPLTAFNKLQQLLKI